MADFHFAFEPRLKVLKLVESVWISFVEEISKRPENWHLMKQMDCFEAKLLTLVYLRLILLLYVLIFMVPVVKVAL